MRTSSNQPLKACIEVLVRLLKNRIEVSHGDQLILNCESRTFRPIQRRMKSMFKREFHAPLWLLPFIQLAGIGNRHAHIFHQQLSLETPKTGKKNRIIGMGGGLQSPVVPARGPVR